MTSVICCPLWSIVYECQRVECACLWYVCDMLHAVLYARTSCFVSWRYINVRNRDVFSGVNMYLDSLKFCLVCINGMSVVVYVMWFLTSDEPTPVLCDLSVRTVVKLCNLGVFCFRDELGFLNCDDI